MMQLSETDAALLQFEKETAPMHTGGFYLFDNSAHNKIFSFENFTEYLSTRLHLARIFRQRLIEVPGNIDRPYWVDDPNFELDHHLSRITLPNDATLKQLKRLSAVVYSHPLNRYRPLWEIKFIDGLEHLEGFTQYHFALIIKVHHATLDAMTGKQIISALLSPFPGVRGPKRVPKWHPDTLPTQLALISKASKHFKKLPQQWISSHGASIVDRAKQTLGANEIKASDRAPDSIFNQSISNDRIFEEVGLSLTRIKMIRSNIPEVTFNDVVLAICANAIRRYLISQDALPEQPLIGMAPVTLKSDNLRHSKAGLLSAMIVPLATDIANPLEQLLTIHLHTSVSDAYRQGQSARTLMDFIPSSTLALASRFYSEYKRLNSEHPLFNIAITNVPGPEIPLYLSGAKLIRQTGMGTIMDGIAMSLTIISYNNRLSFGITACPTVLPDISGFTNHLRAALNDLFQLAQAPETRDRTQAFFEKHRIAESEDINDAGFLSRSAKKIFGAH